MRIIIRHIYLACRHILYALLAIAVAGTVAGCVTENGECPILPEEDKIGVSLSIAGSLPSGTTRAPGEDSEDINGEAGTLAESYINVNDLYIFIFELEKNETVATTDSKLKDILWSPVKEEITTPQSVIYSNGEEVILRTFLDNEKYNTTDNFCIVSVANASKWVDGENLYSSLKPGETTLGSLQKVLDYAKVTVKTSSDNPVHSWIPDNSKSSGIPLFGIKRVSLAGYNTEIYNSGNPYPLGTVWLLRALAKIEISVGNTDQGNLEGDPVENLEIESAQIIARGWDTGLQLIPSPLSRMEGYLTTGSTGQVKEGPTFSNNEYDPALSASALDFTKVTSADGSVSFVAYVPEYGLTSKKDIIQIKFVEYSKVFNLSVSPYNTSGEPITDPENNPYWNCILRNHIYRFVISGIEIDESLDLKWTVCPMDKVEVTIPDFN